MLLCAFIFRRSACQSLELAIRPARDRGRQQGRTRKKTSGEKEENTTSQSSKQANTKIFLCLIKEVTYLILAGEEDEERRKKRNGEAERARKTRTEEGEGWESHRERTRKPGGQRNQWEGRREEAGEGNSDTRTEREWGRLGWNRTTAKHHAAAEWELPGLPRTSSTAHSAAPSSPCEETNEGEREREGSHALLLSPACWGRRRRTAPALFYCLRRRADRGGGGEANEERGRGGGDTQLKEEWEKTTVEKERVSVFVRESVSEQRRDKKPGERARLLLASWRGGGKRKEKNTMSTVKRPRGRVSELLWELGGRRDKGEEEGPAGTEQPPLLLAHAALPPSWTHCCFFPPLHTHLLC